MTVPAHHAKQTSEAPSLYGAALATLFTAYRRLLSPILASSGLGQCRYLPTCSEYAHIALARHGPLRGTVLAAARLFRCHPWAAGGLDPVPPGSPVVSTEAELPVRVAERPEPSSTPLHEIRR